MSHFHPSTAPHFPPPERKPVPPAQFVLELKPKCLAKKSFKSFYLTIQTYSSIYPHQHNPHWFHTVNKLAYTSSSSYSPKNWSPDVCKRKWYDHTHRFQRVIVRSGRCKDFRKSVYLSATGYCTTVLPACNQEDINFCCSWHTLTLLVLCMENLAKPSFLNAKIF